VLSSTFSSPLSSAELNVRGISGRSNVADRIPSSLALFSILIITFSTGLNSPEHCTCACKKTVLVSGTGPVNLNLRPGISLSDPSEKKSGIHREYWRACSSDQKIYSGRVVLVYCYSPPLQPSAK
jgi:hypothetical protein